jgi:uncharacterized membrane protein
MQVEYVKGCSIRDTVTTDIEQAVAAAQRSEVIIAVVTITGFIVGFMHMISTTMQIPTISPR